MQSTHIAEKWLVATLKGDAQLMSMVQGVYVDKVPSNVTSYVLITNADAYDVSYVNKRIGWGKLIYAVRAVGEMGSYSDLVPASSRMHELLHRQRGSTDAGKVLSCHREQPFRMIEQEGNREFRHLGGIYRIMVQG